MILIVKRLLLQFRRRQPWYLFPSTLLLLLPVLLIGVALAATGERVAAVATCGVALSALAIVRGRGFAERARNSGDLALPEVMRRDVVRGYAAIYAAGSLPEVLWAAFNLFILTDCRFSALLVWIPALAVLAGLAVLLLSFREGRRGVRRTAVRWQQRPFWQRNVLVAFGWRRRNAIADTLLALLLGFALADPGGTLLGFLCFVLRGLRLRDRLARFFRTCALDTAPLSDREVATGYLILTLVPMLPALVTLGLAIFMGWTFMLPKALLASFCGSLAGVVLPLLEWRGSHARDLTWATASESLCYQDSLIEPGPIRVR